MPTPPDRPVHYVCQRCGNCCRWPGDVRLTDDDVTRAAAFVGLAEDGFIERFTRINANRTGLSLTEKENGECVFLGTDGRTCRIHPAKPEQCRGFPNRWRFPGWRQICEAIPVMENPPPRPGS